MAFINEYISEEDLQKYGVREIWKYFKDYPSDETCDALVGRYEWTIDRDREVFFIKTGYGRFEESNQLHFALWWKGFLLSATIAKIGGYFDKTTRDGWVYWELIGKWKPKDCDYSDAEIIHMIKEALTAYGYDGINTPTNNFTTDFNF